MKLRKSTIVALVVSGLLPQGVLAANEYPTRSIANPVEPIYRPCTQLERGAKIDPAQCGHLPLSEVVKAWSHVNANE